MLVAIARAGGVARAVLRAKAKPMTKQPKPSENTDQREETPPASDPAVNLDQERPEHPRRVHPPRKVSDKQLRPDRVRGGFDTK